MAVGLQIDLSFNGKVKQNILDEIVKYADLTVKNRVTLDTFYGIIIEESHLFMRKMKNGYYFSIYTCGDPEKEEKSLEYLLKNSEIRNARMLFLKRGKDYGEEKSMGNPFEIFEEIKGFYPNKFSFGGEHHIVDADVHLERVEEIEKLLGNALARYNFQPWGASGIIIDNSIITFHTWPEYDLATFDFYDADLSFVRSVLEKIGGSGKIISLEY